MKIKVLTKLFNRKSTKTMSQVSENRRQEIDRILCQINMDKFKQVEEIITQDQLDNLLLNYKSNL